MGFRETTVDKHREEFVLLAVKPGANVAELARRFGISRRCAYKWIGRWRAEGAEGLKSRSRRPKLSPRRAAPETEARVLAIREESNNAWGGRKIAKTMRGEAGLAVPVASTVTEILRRHGKLAAGAPGHPGPWQRFEHERPNDLWQMDFKGHFAMSAGRCHPFTVLDDHSRYAIGLDACGDETTETVKARLAACFRRYGLPLRILCDNGSPWGSSEEGPHTRLSVWLLRLGIAVVHGRPYHPQTQGKDERFHRTLKAEVLNGRSFGDLADCQAGFDPWRHRYNHERPHEALGLGVPAERYRMSHRRYPDRPPAIDYGPDAILRTVNAAAVIAFERRSWCAGRPFVGETVALKPEPDGGFGVYYCSSRIGGIDNRLIAKGRSHPLLHRTAQEGYPHNPSYPQASYPQEQEPKNEGI
jgi:transposase InsO family protein